MVTFSSPLDRPDLDGGERGGDMVTLSEPYPFPFLPIPRLCLVWHDMDIGRWLVLP